MTTLQQTLNERAATHGFFAINSRIAQQLKDLIRNQDSYEKLTYAQRESLDMIMHKVSRILSGDPKFIDSWRDIAGYAQLVVDELQKDPYATDVRTEKLPVQLELPFQGNYYE